MTTVASVWTNAQFLDGTAIKGHALGLRIAAGNVPNFVDLANGRLGGRYSRPAQQRPDADDGQFRDAGRPAGGLHHAGECGCLQQFLCGGHGSERHCAPTDTLAAAESIARNSWHQPEQLFALLDQFYPVPKGKNLRPVPFMPYLNWAPSAWVLPLKFAGGGYRAGGKAMFDSEGNLWVGDNFTVGWQGQDSYGRVTRPSSRRTASRSRPYYGLHRRRDGRRHLRRGC